MNGDYIAQLKDSRMYRLLLNRENIGPLETLLDAESQKLRERRIQKKEQKKERRYKDLDKKVDRKGLEDLFPQIKEEVDAFLGIDKIDMPAIRYYNLFRLSRIGSVIPLLQYLSGALVLAEEAIEVLRGSTLNMRNIRVGIQLLVAGRLAHWVFANEQTYDSFTNSINLKKEKRSEVIPTIGHEYAHCVQAQSDLGPSIDYEFDIFREGHARGVERYISNKYKDKEGNEEFFDGILDMTVGEMKSVYVWMCKKLGIKPKESLLKTRTSRDFDEKGHRVLRREPTSHAIGNTLFCLYEATKGSSIYKDMLKGNFKFDAPVSNVGASSEGVK